MNFGHTHMQDTHRQTHIRILGFIKRGLISYSLNQSRRRVGNVRASWPRQAKGKKEEKKLS